MAEMAAYWARIDDMATLVPSEMDEEYRATQFEVAKYNERQAVFKAMVEWTRRARASQRQHGGLTYGVGMVVWLKTETVGFGPEWQAAYMITEVDVARSQAKLERWVVPGLDELHTGATPAGGWHPYRHLRPYFLPAAWSLYRADWAEAAVKTRVEPGEMLVVDHCTMEPLEVKWVAEGKSERATDAKMMVLVRAGEERRASNHWVDWAGVMADSRLRDAMRQYVKSRYLHPRQFFAEVPVEQGRSALIQDLFVGRDSGDSGEM